MRVIILGFDGATFDVIRPLMNVGALPNLARLAVEGASGTLRSTIHPITPAAWTSSFTGLNPGKHGVYSFEALRRYSYAPKLNNARSRHGKTIWQVLGERGKRVGIFNVPMTYPPLPVNGFLVSGMDAPSTRTPFTFPESLAEPLLAAVPGYQIDFSNDRDIDLKTYCENVQAAFDSHVRAFEYLTERFAPLDFTMAVFVASDRLQHKVWHYWDPMDPAYNAPDAALFREVLTTAYRRFDVLVGHVLDQLDDQTLLLVMSDHGFGPLHKYVRMNRWLGELGLLTFEPAGSERPWEAPINWEKTRAWAHGPFGDIRVNLRGRYPLGTVAPSKEYEQIRETLCRELGALRDPDGNAVIESAFLREELYRGAYVEQAPDIVPVFKDYAYLAYAALHGMVGPVFVERSRENRAGGLMVSGAHRLDGVIYAYGRGVAPGLQLRDAHIMDIAPTVLAWSGVEVDEVMDGKALPIFEPGRPTARTVAITTPAQENGQAQHEEIFRSDEEIAELRETIRYLTLEVSKWERGVAEAKGLHASLSEWNRELLGTIAQRDAELNRVKHFLPLSLALSIRQAVSSAFSRFVDRRSDRQSQ